LVFVNTGENSVKADDVITPSNPPVALIENEEFEKPPLDVTVSQ
jgi:hypothetical protein